VGETLNIFSAVFIILGEEGQQNWEIKGTDLEYERRERGNKIYKMEDLDSVLTWK
jgi:hypothetical protein